MDTWRVKFTMREEHNKKKQYWKKDLPSPTTAMAYVLFFFFLRRLHEDARSKLPLQKGIDKMSLSLDLSTAGISFPLRFLWLIIN